MAKSSLPGGEQARATPSGSDVQTDASHTAPLDEGEEGAWPLDHDYAGAGDAAGTGDPNIT